MQPQAELSLGLSSEVVPAEWEQYEVPAGYERAGDVIRIRRLGKDVAVDSDGEILKATRRSRDRMVLRFPDGKKIEETGFDRFMSKIALAREHAREYRLAIARSKEAEERAKKAAQEAEKLREQERARGERMATLVEETSVAKPRLRNKLATNREARARREPTEADFINPKNMLEGLKGGSEWQFAAVPRWMNAIEGITKGEQIVYGWMVFRADNDGVFRKSLFSLKRDCDLSYRGLLKIVESLIDKDLIYKATSREQHPNDYRFLRVRAMDGWPKDSEQRSRRIVNSVHRDGRRDSEQSSQLKKPSNEKPQKRILAPDGEQRLLEEIRSIVGTNEMKKNGAMWRMRMRCGSREIKALRNAIEDYRVRTPAQKSAIENRAAWFTDRYQRNLAEIEKADRASAHA